MYIIVVLPFFNEICLPYKYFPCSNILVREECLMYVVKTPHQTSVMQQKSCLIQINNCAKICPPQGRRMRRIDLPVFCQAPGGVRKLLIIFYMYNELKMYNIHGEGWGRGRTGEVMVANS